jgi:myo-inositol-1(or 4)-monophosphatase
MKFADELQIVKSAVIEAGELLTSYFGQQKFYHQKEDQSLVSKADKESEKLLSERILGAYPKSEFIGEETGIRKGLTGFQRRWAVDPLDGTTNFIYGIPMYCVSVGMQFENDWVLGVVYNPQTKDMYWGVKGEGAFHNDRKISIGSATDLGEAVIGIGRAFSSIYQTSVHDFYKFLSHVRAVRSMGAAALDMARVAEGALDLYLCKGLSIWDTAASNVILREAGAVVCDFSGKDYDPNEPNIITASPRLMKQFLDKKFQF